MTILRSVLLLESTTLILLVGVAVPLKYLADLPVATSIMGPMHGLAFMSFVWFVIRSRAEGIIDAYGTTRLVVGAFIPGAGFINERWLNRQSEEE
ncbi:DUF3817 domain-containing protein [uncultured Roseobacter sp.]|uniref:DUF3817 domain-containing protein n=1 Tax=uncultured Roseobacter sp. TaxID=114847 RepID=UPI00260BD3D9|nr:DUF3817 domain-containing protein [uncultured Roseobacter sp.]